MPCKYWDHGWCTAPDDAEANDVDGQCGYMDACPQAIPITSFIFTPAVRGLTYMPDDGDDSEEHW